MNTNYSEAFANILSEDSCIEMRDTVISLMEVLSVNESGDLYRKLTNLLEYLIDTLSAHATNEADLEVVYEYTEIIRVCGTNKNIQ